MKMMGSSEVDKKCSDKKMEIGDDGVRTVECLRGRLLAERQASRIAKEDVERMGNKLVELEKMLKEEIRMRNKAEKKLKFLKKKLEDSNMILVEESEKSGGSEEVSCKSTTISSITSTNNDLLEENNSDFHITDSVTNSQEESSHNNDSENSIGKQSQEKFPSYNGQGTGAIRRISSSNCPEDFLDNPSCKSEDFRSEYNSSADMKSSAAGNGSSDHEEDYNEDNSLALVPLSLPDDQSLVAASKEVKPVHQNVAEVLHSLRYIRENIQRSIEIGRMVRVGPS